MKFAEVLTAGLGVQLFIIGVVYAFQRDWPRCGYFVSASVLNAFILMMH